MTKKIIIITLAVVLCLSVIGGCFALYAKNAELNITFGSEDAVVLTLSPAGSDSLTFGNVKLNPTTKSANQSITLDVTTNDKTALSGMNGKLTVLVSGALANSLNLSAVADAVNYTQEQLTSGVTLPLNALPKDFTLTVALSDDIDDAAFKNISNTTASITVKWEVVDWAPVDGGYYIIGSFSGWDVNEDAIYLDKDVAGTDDVAAVERASLKVGDKFKVVQYHAAAEKDWLDVKWENGSASVGEGVEVLTTEGNNITVTVDGDYFVCVNQYNQVWIEKLTTPAA